MISKQTRKEIKKETMGYMAGALGLVAGLAWNDAIKSLIEFFFPFSKSTLFVKFFYAVIITIIVVLIGKYILSPREEGKK